MKTILKAAIGDQRGAALTMVLILLVVGGLILAPLLGLMSTGLLAGRVYEDTMYQLYAADAGIDDGLWQVRNDQLDTDLFGVDDPQYDPYAYYDCSPSYQWDYHLNDHQGDEGGVAQVVLVNDKDVLVTIENVWIPKGIEAPDSTEARDIIEGGELIIVGGITGASQYQISLTYYYREAADEDGENLKVQTIGIWLPPGFDYTGNCTLADDPDTEPYSLPDIDDHCGGKAVLWEFPSPLPLKEFPGATSYPCEGFFSRSFSFQFSPAGGNPAAAVSWIDTEGVAGIDFTWDGDLRVYKITSTATDPHTGKETTVDSYSSKIEVRKLGSAIAGDYVAIGNSLMMPDLYNSPNEDWRSRLLKESSAGIQSTDPSSSSNYLPPTATVEAAYLYWSGWIDHYYWYYYDGGWFNRGWRWSNYTNTWNVTQDNLTGLVYDPDNLEEMVEGWTDGSGKGAKVNTVNFGSAGHMQDITADQWQVWPKTNDSPACWYYACLYDATSIVKPLIESGVTAFVLGHATTVTNQLRPGFPRLPSASSSSHTSPGYAFNLYSASGSSTVGYTGYPLGTPAHRLPGSSSYDDYDGRYHASYAGWSLVIVYSAPDSKIKNQLYLYDIKSPRFTFRESFPAGASESNPDFDGDGSPGGSISGFLVPDRIQRPDGTLEDNAAKMTCFVGEGDKGKTGDSFNVTGPSGNMVNLRDGTNEDHPDATTWDEWNSKSVGLTAAGIDVDTFHVSWDSNILRTGDTWAQVDIPTEGDGFTLVYVILSFRSAVTTGGIMGYLIR